MIVYSVRSRAITAFVQCVSSDQPIIINAIKDIVTPHPVVRTGNIPRLVPTPGAQLGGTVSLGLLWCYCHNWLYIRWTLGDSSVGVDKTEMGEGSLCLHRDSCIAEIGHCLVKRDTVSIVFGIPIFV